MFNPNKRNRTYLIFCIFETVRPNAFLPRPAPPKKFYSSTLPLWSGLSRRGVQNRHYSTKNIHFLVLFFLIFIFLVFRCNLRESAWICQPLSFLSSPFYYFLSKLRYFIGPWVTIDEKIFR